MCHENSGIDVDKYKTHSTRGAVTSKAKQSGNSNTGDSESSWMGIR